MIESDTRLWRGRVVGVVGGVVHVRVGEVPAAGESTSHLPGVWIEQEEDGGRFVQINAEFPLSLFEEQDIAPTYWRPIDILWHAGALRITSPEETP